jgi:PAS domain S-box-containing protein
VDGVKDELEEDDAASPWDAAGARARRSALEELARAQEGQARLAAIVESSHDAIVSKTLDSRVRSWNAAAEELFGYTADEMIGQPITRIIPPDRHDEERMILERIRRGERVEHYETVRVTKDGRRIDVSLTISPIRDAAGRIVGASKIARDIGARKRAEQTSRFLAEASAALAAVTEAETALRQVAALAVPLFADWCTVDVLEVDGTIRRVAAAHFDGARLERLRELERRYPPRTSDRRGAGRVIRTGEVEWASAMAEETLAELAVDDEHLRSLRGLGIASYVSVPLRSRGRVLGALTFGGAGSGRTYSADDVRTMEDLASRAVIAMENATLLATLRADDRRKDEFLAMLAHELRNPLAPIRNASHFLRARGPAELQWAADVIERQVHQMTRLVDDLLDVSRITRGKIELRRERVDLASVLKTAIEATRPLVEKWEHELTTVIPPEPVRLDADPTRLAQVFSNILTNAAKYTDQGGHIRLTVEPQGEQVLVRVKDDGIGIPKEALPSVFDLFTQLPGAEGRSEGGLGIGLTLVRRIVELHGGAVEARSDGPGRGSEFLVRIPIARETTAAAGRPGEGGTVAPPARRILVVDDNQDAADTLGMLLGMTGNEVEIAHDGLAAVEAVAGFRPDVVLLDLGLPKLSGYEVARRIRGGEGGARILLVALTGWGQEEDRRRSKDAGFDHHLTKPVEFDELQRLLAGVSRSDVGQRPNEG